MINEAATILPETEVVRMPSREFLVRQGVMNGIAKCFPATVKNHGLPKACKIMRLDEGVMEVEANALPYILEAFHDLCARYNIEVTP